MVVIKPNGCKIDERWNYLQPRHPQAPIRKGVMNCSVHNWKVTSAKVADETYEGE